MTTISMYAQDDLKSEESVKPSLAPFTVASEVTVAKVALICQSMSSNVPRSSAGFWSSLSSRHPIQHNMPPYINTKTYKSQHVANMAPGRPGGGRGVAGKGLGMGHSGAKRHRKILRDNISGISKADIRRLARRGGVKRISATIYEEVRAELKHFLKKIMDDIAAIVEMCRRKTICTTDVVWALNRQGHTLYGFGSGQIRNQKE
ncbi:hypothetical protein MBLNU13_g09921t1 [Cladosporium sp. NU13]